MKSFTKHLLVAIMSLVVIWSTNAIIIPKEDVLLLNSSLSLSEFENLLAEENEKLSELKLGSKSAIKEIVYENWEIRWWITLKSWLSPKETILDIKERLEKSNAEKLKIWENQDVSDTLKNLIKNSDVSKIEIVEIITEPSINSTIKDILSDKIEPVEIDLGEIPQKKLNREYSRAPNHWTTEVSQNYANNTFVFYDVSEFMGNKTYEHETHVYNKKYASYGWDWDSNLPRAYKDTGFWDKYRNFTIWSADANQIDANTEYYTNMTLNPGSETDATIRIKWQIWHRIPSNCYSTRCIFWDATSSTLISGYWSIPWICWSR